MSQATKPRNAGRKTRAASFAAIVLATGSIALTVPIASQPGQPDPTDDDGGQPSRRSGAESQEHFSPTQLMGGLGQQIIEGLRASPGCLGADAASFPPNKLAIFGWFEDKDAALEWHSSDLHRGVSQRFAGGRTMDRVPMEHVRDGVPIMVIASVAMEPVEGGMPRMLFGIEIYEPMPGGFSFQGGAFSPRPFQDLMEQLRQDARE